jgi:hypothetical protein
MSLARLSVSDSAWCPVPNAVERRPLFRRADAAVSHGAAGWRFAHDFSGVQVRAGAPTTERGGPGDGDEDTPTLSERIERTVRGIVCTIGRSVDPVIGPLTHRRAMCSAGALKAKRADA